ncbi:flagellar M-ring protein FliF [Desulfuribacillus stibiiarsenatis]|uniref:Flagellar M-ring protein n=1 Tax=Desulfuribacillus stibiiarsenatis TaxID=1390249 RepID=A0A1E5L6Z1_9FIRM|nr:flagellar basal-body MS-ring/collar protein FliF [Desulfuribacillus stibiiarsenatis]OEH85818.1 flagellar M-ring protein FliF [Desulfuribacillus stibiiarsenatis]
MNEKVKVSMDKGIGYWQGLEKNQKIKIAASAAFILAAFVFLSVWAMTPEYTSIVTNVSDTEAGEIIKELENLGVPYKLEGSSILVPQSRAIKARYDLAASGYPKSGSIDYGIFTDTGFGMTKDQFSILKKSALEGELEKTVKKIVVVEDARVHLNIPEPSVWVRGETEEASAAVYLNLKTGVSLDDNQIAGIEQLVVMSVPGVARENVILIDQNGRRLLSSNSGNGQSISDVYSSHIDIKSKIEGQIQKSLRNSLESVMGVGNVVVDAVAKINFDQLSKEESLVSPVVGDQGIIISKQEENESSTTGSQEGGVPGTTGNDPATYEAGDGQTGTYERNFLIENREVNRTHIVTKAQPFRVEDLSISIILNDREGQEISDALIQNINTMAKNVVLATATENLNPDDVKISVLAYKFDTSLADQLAAQGMSPLEMLYVAGAIVGALVVAGGAFTYWRRKKKEEDVQELVPQAIEENYDIELNDEGQQVKKQLEKLALSKPEDFTKLLRTWLMED